MSDLTLINKTNIILKAITPHIPYSRRNELSVSYKFTDGASNIFYPTTRSSEDASFSGDMIKALSSSAEKHNIYFSIANTSVYNTLYIKIVV